MLIHFIVVTGMFQFSILFFQIADLANEDTPQLYVACGRGPRSSLRVLRHGLEVSEMAVSELPGNPNAVWTVKQSMQDEFDSYIVVSFVNATLVLSIGETVEEVTDSGFLGTTPTLSCSQLGDDALIQVGECVCQGGRGRTNGGTKGGSVDGIDGGQTVFYHVLAMSAVPCW